MVESWKRPLYLRSHSWLLGAKLREHWMVFLQRMTLPSQSTVSVQAKKSIIENKLSCCDRLGINVNRCSA